MSTISAPLPGAVRSRTKIVVWTIIGLMMAYVLYHNESFLINRSNPVWQHYQPFKWWLLPHGLAAACAILLGPLQFIDRLRQRYTKLHRVLGRIYVIGAIIGGPLGAYIQYFEHKHMGETVSFSIAAAADAVLLVLTTGVGFIFAYRRKIQQHRQWMTRSYAVAIVFLEVRVISGITGWESPQAIETIVWTCLVFAVFIGDIAIQWQDLWKSKPEVAKVRAATAAAAD